LRLEFVRILLAPDKFKDCLSAAQVARAMSEGIRRARSDAAIGICPIADGGEGTVEALVGATGGRFEFHLVTGPLPDMKTNARFGFLGDGTTAVVEMAAASGLALLPLSDRDPLRTTTFGTGELMMHAIKLGAAKIILGLGGSATLDAGIGCAQACGLPVLLDDGEPLSLTEPLIGADLARVMFIKHNRGSPIDRIPILTAADVTNPLLGPHGAATIFGPQKGASPQQILQFEQWLQKLARRTGTLDIAALPGAGAAGGLGYAMAAFFKAALRPGIELVLETVRFRDRLRNADLCITGEGRLDASTLHGKSVAGVAAACRNSRVPCIAIAGSIEPGPDYGLMRTITLDDGKIGVEESMKCAPELIAAAAERAVSIS
jgi:glycerate 2-kinase